MWTLSVAALCLLCKFGASAIRGTSARFGGMGCPCGMEATPERQPTRLPTVLPHQFEGLPRFRWHDQPGTVRPLRRSRLASRSGVTGSLLRAEALECKYGVSHGYPHHHGSFR